MHMARKRLIEESEEVELTHINPSKNVKLQGMISVVSPMKMNASGTAQYFDGELTDGKGNMRFVGFESKQ